MIPPLCKLHLLGYHFNRHSEHTGALHCGLATDGGHVGEVLYDDGDDTLRGQRDLYPLALVLLQLFDWKLVKRWWEESKRGREAVLLV